MKSIHYQDIISGSQYDLLVGSYYREMAVNTIIRAFRQFKNTRTNTPKQKPLLEPQDDGFYEHLNYCLKSSNYHKVHLNHPNFTRRLYGAVRSNILDINQFLMLQLLREMLTCFHSGILPQDAETKLEKFSLHDQHGPLNIEKEISYWNQNHSNWFDFLINHPKYKNDMHYYAFKLPIRFLLSFFYYALKSPGQDNKYLDLLDSFIRHHAVDRMRKEQALREIEHLKHKFDSILQQKLQKYLLDEFESYREPPIFPTKNRLINADSMRILATLFKLNTQIPSICVQDHHFYFILININALNQIQRILHPSESIMPTPCLGTISTRMIRAYDEIPEQRKHKKQLTDSQLILQRMFPHVNLFKQSSRPIESLHPEVKYNDKPHGYHTYPFLLMWHDIFHSWRSGCHYKGIIRNMRTIFDEGGGLTKKPTIMSKMIWSLTDMDFGFSVDYRMNHRFNNPENQLQYYSNILLWFLFSNIQKDNAYLYFYHLFKPNGPEIFNFMGLDIQHLDRYLHQIRLSHAQNLYDNIDFIQKFQNKIKVYLSENPDAHFMEVYLFCIFEPYFPINSSIIQFFRSRDYSNYFQWKKNDGIHFSKKFFEELSPYELESRVNKNSPIRLNLALMTYINNEHQSHVDLKPS